MQCRSYAEPALVIDTTRDLTTYAKQYGRFSVVCSTLITCALLRTPKQGTWYQLRADQPHAPCLLLPVSWNGNNVYVKQPGNNSDIRSSDRLDVVDSFTKEMILIASTWRIHQYALSSALFSPLLSSLEIVVTLHSHRVQTRPRSLNYSVTFRLSAATPNKVIIASSINKVEKKTLNSANFCIGFIFYPVTSASFALFTLLSHYCHLPM